MVMEGISALMDGELDEREAQQELGRLKADAQLRERWDAFHLVGDALRGERVLSSGFHEAFATRLAAEPTVLAPRRSTRNAKRITTYALSAAASVSAAALVAWVAVAPNGVADVEAFLSPQSKGQLADARAGSAVPAAMPPMTSVSSNGSMNEYLLAHQGFSPSTALQGLAPYIRSVSATAPAEGR
jgi:sigma-E factor negative regulatory protein RseA